jgi:putative methyltransferase (TIGR04325 family)
MPLWSIGRKQVVNPRVKAVLKQVLPPVVVEAAKFVRDRALARQRGHDDESVSPPMSKRGSGAAAERPEWEAVPDSEAVWTAHQGWSHQSIADTQRKKWPAFLASIEGTRPFGWSHEAPPGVPLDVSAHNTIITFGHVLGRAATARTRIGILDWGGGVGHYYSYARRLRPDLELDYVVKDLGPLCEVGREVLPEVTFMTDETEALSRNYDLVFASSSLQYSRDLYGVLGRLCDAAAGWLMVTRSPFVDRHDDFVVVQRPHRYGYLTEYPAWFINRHRFIAAVEARGFGLDREFMLGERPYVANAPEQCLYRGFLFKRIN